MPDPNRSEEILRAIELLQRHNYTVVAPWRKKEPLTPAKALRILIDAKKRDATKAERRAKVRERINAAIERMLNPFARRDRPNAH